MANVLSFDIARIQREIKKLLTKAAQRRLKRSTIIRELAALASPKLTRGERRTFAAQVGRALAGLQNREPPIVTAAGRGKEVIVLRGAKRKRPNPSFQQLVKAVNPRIISVTFSCAVCAEQITVRDIESEIQCPNCYEYFQ